MVGSDLLSALMSLLMSVFTLPLAVMRTFAGSHLALAAARFVQVCWQLASTDGGLNSPEHFGSLTCAVQPPEHEPEHCAAAFISHEPEQLPSHVPPQVPSAFASHLPSQVPLQAALLSLPSHLPSQVPSHLPEISALHSPLQVPLHEPSHEAPSPAGAAPFCVLR